jgi:hypothetical protein
MLSLSKAHASKRRKFSPVFAQFATRRRPVWWTCPESKACLEIGALVQWVDGRPGAVLTANI